MPIVELEGSISGIRMANRERGRSRTSTTYGNNGSVTPLPRMTDISQMMRNIGWATAEEAMGHIRPNGEVGGLSRRLKR